MVVLIDRFHGSYVHVCHSVTIEMVIGKFKAVGLAGLL